MKPAKFVMIPCPYEKTTSYGKGTKTGPRAILKAARYLEDFDHETGIDLSQTAGVQITKPVKFAKLKDSVLSTLKDKKVPIVLGGEHTISFEAVRAAKEAYPDLSVLQFDAHADLRDEFKGKKLCHATVMRRVWEVCPLVQAGIRSMSREEWDFAEKYKQIKKIHFMGSNSQHINTGDILSQLTDDVYMTFDVDVLDPAIMPSTGTPEPGGLLWYEALDIIKTVCAEKIVVGADFVELMPIKGLSAPDFTAAKLAYKLMNYIYQASK